MKRRTEPGFTLLEVLAAVAILGIWFAVLANVAIQSLRKEGENERRIRASLIADRETAELELGFDTGVPLEEIAREFEEDEFVIVIEPLELAEAVSPESDLMALLESDLGHLLPYLHVVRVKVTWTEGTAEQSVSRMAYYSSLIEELVGPNQPVPGEGDGEGAASGSGADATDLDAQSE